MKGFNSVQFYGEKSHSKSTPLCRDLKSILREGKLFFLLKQITPVYIWCQQKVYCWTNIRNTTWFKNILVLTQKHLNATLSCDNNKEQQNSAWVLVCGLLNQTDLKYSVSVNQQDGAIGTTVIYSFWEHSF